MMGASGPCENDSKVPDKSLRFLGVWRFIVFLNIGTVIYLSLMPAPEQMGQFFGMDKIMHILAYSFCMFWAGLCFKGKKNTVIFSTGLILMGIMLEIVQGMTGYRSMSIFDAAANSVGVFTGIMLGRTRLGMLLSYVEKWI